MTEIFDMLCNLLFENHVSETHIILKISSHFSSKAFKCSKFNTFKTIKSKLYYYKFNKVNTFDTLNIDI